MDGDSDGVSLRRFGCAIGVHFVEGYTNPMHLAPAFAGAVLFLVSMGLLLWRSAK